VDIVIEIDPNDHPVGAMAVYYSPKRSMKEKTYQLQPPE
jgi:hypothetical protein